jgi:hypothetical protein
MASPFIHTLTSFSGADLVVNFANQVVGELQQISWAIQREKAPVFTLGSSDPRSFSRGKRGIAGSMVFAVFDNDAIVNALLKEWQNIAPKAMFSAAGNVAVRGSEDFSKAMDLTNWNKAATDAANYTQGTTGIGNGYGYAGTQSLSPGQQPGSNNIPTVDTEGNIIGWTPSTDQIYVPAGFSPIRGDNILYADMLPPFDVTMTFANEYGQCAFQKIYDVDILNEGSGVSVDTIVMERQMTYIARRISPLIKGVYSRDQGGAVKGLRNPR